MGRYVVRRLLLALMILWFISIIVFLLMRIAPGDPALLQQGINATPENVARVHRELGLDDPYPVQYARWLKGFVTFDYGTSYLFQTDVSTEFGNRLPVSLELMALTVIWTVLLGIPFGVISAVTRNGWPDYVVRVFAVVGLAVPSFWVATLVLIVPVAIWGYAPPLNSTTSLFSEPIANLKQMGPPSFVLALGSTAGIMRLVRSELLEVLRADYVRTARAKGLSQRLVIVRHALRNSMIPVVTVLGLLISGLLGGAVIVETVFNLQGLGYYLFRSVLAKDFTVVQTLVMFTATVSVLMTLGVDLLYGVLDPRIRYS